MSPSTLIEPPREETFDRHAEDRASAGRNFPLLVHTSGNGKNTASRRKTLFSEALLEASTTRPQHRATDFFLSVVLHVVVLLTLVLVPLYYTETIDLKQFTQIFLVAPPPPPPLPPASPLISRAVTASRRVFAMGSKLVAPAAVPQKIAMLKEEPLPPDVGASGGVMGGVPGGVPGGQVGGVLGGIIGGGQRSYVPVGLSPRIVRSPIRVGGRVKPPKARFTPDPVYPVLARQARIQGDVEIDAVIDTSGNIVEMRAISGQVLLIPAALAALSQWKYEPTYLNDEPVPVQLVVTIHFRLN